MRERAISAIHVAAAPSCHGFRRDQARPRAHAAVVATCPEGNPKSSAGTEVPVAIGGRPDSKAPNVRTRASTACGRGDANAPFATTVIASAKTIARISVTPSLSRHPNPHTMATARQLGT